MLRRILDHGDASEGCSWERHTHRQTHTDGTGQRESYEPWDISIQRWPRTRSVFLTPVVLMWITPTCQPTSRPLPSFFHPSTSLSHTCYAGCPSSTTLPHTCSTFTLIFSSLAHPLRSLFIQPPLRHTIYAGSTSHQCKRNPDQDTD